MERRMVEVFVQSKALNDYQTQPRTEWAVPQRPAHHHGVAGGLVQGSRGRAAAGWRRNVLLA